MTLLFFLKNVLLQVSPNDGLPTIVCNTCRTQLDTCQQFRDKAQRSQQKLQNFLKFANKLTGDPQVRIINSFKIFQFLFVRFVVVIFHCYFIKCDNFSQRECNTRTKVDCVCCYCECAIAETVCYHAYV